MDSPNKTGRGYRQRNDKKVFALLMAVMMLVSMTACGGEKGKEGADSKIEATEPAPETKPSETADDNTIKKPSGIQDDGMGEARMKAFWPSSVTSAMLPCLPRHPVGLDD